jgi:hypothetical protein
MIISIFALAAAAAAQAAAPQALTPEQARAQGYAAAQQALANTVTQPQGTLLWRNVYEGMSVGQLHALYPQSGNVDWHNDRTVLTDVPIMDNCQAKVNIMHPNGAVTEIVMRGEGAIAGRCSLRLVTALSGKYGEPMDKDKVHGSLFGREGKNYIWAHDGVTLQFKRYTSGALGGGGLLAASWELRYSTVDTKIDL